MNNGVSQKLVSIKTELRAQKVAMELAYSSILWPENTPTATWGGNVNLVLVDNVVARFRARYSRSDGSSDAPFVDFAQNVTFTPNYKDYTISEGRTITGNDVDYVDDQNYTGYVAGTGNGYVDYYIDFVRDLIANYNTLSSIRADITVQAISMTPGTLTITRVI